MKLIATTSPTDQKMTGGEISYQPGQKGIKSKIFETLDLSVRRFCMRRFIFALMSAISFLALSGCLDDRVLALEKHAAELEMRVKILEDAQKAKADAAVANQARFEQCVRSADDEFDNGLRLNGTKNANGSYAVSTTSLQSLQRQKQNKLEECKLLYK